MPVHKLELEEPECNTADDTFYVDRVDPIDACVDTVNPQVEVRDEGFDTLIVHNKPLEMKIDTGAKCNVISKDTFDKLSTGQSPVEPKT